MNFTVLTISVHIVTLKVPLIKCLAIKITVVCESGNCMTDNKCNINLEVQNYKYHRKIFQTFWGIKFHIR